MERRVLLLSHGDTFVAMARRNTRVVCDLRPAAAWEPAPSHGRARCAPCYTASPYSTTSRSTASRSA
jgi:hypothetical protein